MRAAIFAIVSSVESPSLYRARKASNSSTKIDRLISNDCMLSAITDATGVVAETWRSRLAPFRCCNSSSLLKSDAAETVKRSSLLTDEAASTQRLKRIQIDRLNSRVGLLKEVSPAGSQP